MSFEVILMDSATREIEAIWEWLRERAPTNARIWVAGLQEAIHALADFPTGHGFARENGTVDVELRQLLYGKRQHKYRVIYTVKCNEVFVLHIRHPAREAMKRGEIELPPGLN